jgi:rSAM/selenodomain-associated transferase 1
MTSSTRPPELRVAVFARAPVAGEVKTRLVPLLGADGAARLHAALVRRALATACEARVGAVELWCAPDERHPFFEVCARQYGATLHRQQGADLGERMQHAFELSLAARRALLLIGSDCPALAPADLLAAAAALASHDAVIAPAEDGGYVLVGLARAMPAIFRDIAWGGPGVMAETRARLDAANARWTAMRTLWDVDRPEDVARLQGAGLAAELVS